MIDVKPDLLAERLTRLGAPHYAELAAEAATGRLSLLIVPRGVAAPMGRLKHADRPALVLVGDDDYQSSGPVGWPNAARLIRWCDRLIIHASGTKPGEYREIARAASLVRRVLLVETSSACAQAWRDLAGRKPGITFLPSGGGCHPIPETVH